jgi:hypothetical protein
MLVSLPDEQLLFKFALSLDHPVCAHHQSIISKQNLNLIDILPVIDLQHREIGLTPAQPNLLIILQLNHPYIQKTMVEKFTCKTHLQIEELILQPVCDTVLHIKRKCLG